MRMDKFLKVSRVIKRRTVAKEACEACRVTINDRVAKASAEVREGDIMTIRFGNKRITIRVLNVLEHPRKEEAAGMYEILDEE